MNQPRVKVVVSLLNNGEVMFSEGHDPSGDQTFYIPLGGGLDFGETLEECAKREIKEEANIELNEVTLVNFFENHFTFNNQPGHEIIFHYFSQISAETRNEIGTEGVESDGTVFPIKWFNKTRLIENSSIIVPPQIVEPLLEML